MRLGLWVPLAAMSTNTAVYREHPEWICKDIHGKPKFTGTMAGAQAVMCLATPYREVGREADQRLDRPLSPELRQGGPDHGV